MKLSGKHQVENAITSVCGCEQLKRLGWNITDNAIKDGLEKTNWRGRLEILKNKPLVVIDVAHNPEGISVLVNSLSELVSDKNFIFVFGVMEGKDYPKMLEILSGYADSIVLTQSSYHKGLDISFLEKEMRKRKTAYVVVPKIDDAYRYALYKSGSEDAVCVTGSHFVVGELLEKLENRRRNLR